MQKQIQRKRSQRRQKQQRKIQTRRHRRQFRKGGFMRDGSRLPQYNFINDLDYVNLNKNACQHAQWTGEL